MIEVQVRHKPSAKSLFVYAAMAVPRIGEQLALTIDDEGFLVADVLQVVHIPLRAPKTKQVNGKKQMITSGAMVLIDDSDLDVAAFVARQIQKQGE